MIQLVNIPPRAGDTNEPEIRVGMALPAGAGSNGLGVADVSVGSSKALNAQTPAAPATPRRSAARRESSGMCDIMPSRTACARRATPDQL